MTKTYRFVCNGGSKEGAVECDTRSDKSQAINPSDSLQLDVSLICAAICDMGTAPSLVGTAALASNVSIVSAVVASAIAA